MAADNSTSLLRLSICPSQNSKAERATRSWWMALTGLGGARCLCSADWVMVRFPVVSLDRPTLAYR
jgi:hypothetical protein